MVRISCRHVEIQRGPGRSSGRRKQRRLSHSVEDELHGQTRKQHTGYPADNVGARLPQTAHKALRNEHGDICDSEADRDHQHDRSPLQPDLRAAHDQHDSRKTAGARNHRKRQRKYRDVAGALRNLVFRSR